MGIEGRMKSVRTKAVARGDRECAKSIRVRIIKFETFI